MRHQKGGDTLIFAVATAANGHLDPAYKGRGGVAMHSSIYRSLLKIRPWAMNFSDCSKRGVGVFSRTSLSKIGPLISKVGPPVHPKYRICNQHIYECHTATVILYYYYSRSFLVSRNNLFV